MKATLEFNLPEDESAFRQAQNGAKLESILWELDQRLRTTAKHGTDQVESAFAEKIRLELADAMQESCVAWSV